MTDRRAQDGAAEGMLVVVGTPIGNLGDLSPRAVEALREADVLYCEDTRRTRGLLTHVGVTGATLRSLHGHNEDVRVDEVVRAVEAGRTVALVSDAGMPAVSDPGARVVAAVVAAGLPVTAVPGPSAVLTALVVSGLATDRFCFEGFLPRSGAARTARLEALAAEPRTAVLFEAPPRVAATLRDLAARCGDDRLVAVVRELTKVHEEVRRGTLGEVAAWAAGHAPRGEIVLVLAGTGSEPAPVDDREIGAALDAREVDGGRTREVVDDVAADLGVPRRRVYRLALARRQASGGGVDPAAPE